MLLFISPACLFPQSSPGNDSKLIPGQPCGSWQSKHPIFLGRQVVIYLRSAKIFFSSTGKFIDM